MSEKTLIRHCSPTLAGIKTGSLFSCTFSCEREMQERLRTFNQRLGSKGLRVLPMRYRNHRALIYVYRPSHLERDLYNEQARQILCDRGYSCENHLLCVAQLARKLNASADFPHEIGLFLGYPPEDVYGFIEKGADACKCVGCWCVYGDEEKAQALFAKYRKCTGVYSAQLEKGRTVEQLTVCARV